MTIAGVIVAVDREERGPDGMRTTLAALQDELGAPVHAIVTISEVAAYLGGRGILAADRVAAIHAHLAEHGVKGSSAG